MTSSSNKSIADETEVVTDSKKVTSLILKFYNDTKSRTDVYVDRNGFSVVTDVELYKQEYHKLKERGVKIRVISEVTKENIAYYKNVMEWAAEIRHLEGIKGNFVINETEYIAANEVLKEGKPVTQILFSNVEAIVSQQRYLFDSLWNKAISAELKVREIKEGILPEKTEVIPPSSDAIEHIYKNIIKEAKQDIMLILPTVNTVKRQKRIGILDLLKEASSNGVKVRLLVHTKEEEEGANKQDMNDLESHDVLVNQLSMKPPQQQQKEEVELKEGGDAGTRVTAIIADNNTSLVIELQNDEKECFVDAIGSAVLSTGKALASSYARIFESLWLETEQAVKLRESDKMQREFINIAAHELRTPIQPILGLADIIESEFRDSSSEKVEVTKEDADIIIRNACRLERLTSDILELARIESNDGLILHKSEFNIREIVSKAMIDAEVQIHSGNYDNYDNSSSNI